MTHYPQIVGTTLRCYGANDAEHHDPLRWLHLFRISRSWGTTPIGEIHGMLDRAIGLLGLALALIFGLWSLAPEGWPKMPTWAVLLGVGVGILLVGLATGLVVGEQRKPIDTDEPQLIETNLFLQFSDAHSIPIEKNPRNIRNWYALYTESIYVDMKDAEHKSLGSFAVPPRWAIFMMFEKPPIFRQMVAVCRGPNNPTCTVSTSNASYAVISIAGDVTGATLDVSIIK